MSSALKLAILTTLLAPASLWSFDLDRPEVEEFVSDLVNSYQFERAYVQDALSDSDSKDSILEAISRPAEKTKSWHEYRDIFIKPKRIKAGAKFWSEHEAALERIELETGVPAEMLVGIIGVESYFGRRTGSYRVIDALATLGFDYPPRSSFFKSELAQLFLLAREERFELAELKGSYAGAMGPPQFIPSSYRAYAVDGNGDGQRNLFTDWEDILMSVANYFVAHNWQAGQPVASQGTLSSSTNDPPVNKGLKPNETVASLSEYGVMFSTDLDGSAPAQLLELEGENGLEYWVGFHNFYVITRYNRSVLYALAAYQLGQAVAAAANPAQGTAHLTQELPHAVP